MRLLAQRLFPSSKSPAPAKISDSERQKYVLVMLGGPPGGDPRPAAPRGDNGVVESLPVPAGRPGASSASSAASAAVVESQSSNWFWYAVFFSVFVVLLALLWSEWVRPVLTIGPGNGSTAGAAAGATDGPAATLVGHGVSYGITPALSSFMSPPDLGSAAVRRRVEAAKAYIRERTIPPVLASAPREWREKLFSLEVSTDTSTPGDMTQDLPYQQMKIVSNEGMGDCLFLCWREVLAEKGVDASVASLREVVADAVATPEKLEFLKGLYAAAREERDAALVSDYSFMNGVESVEGLRAAIKTRAYFGDEMALDALEAEFGVRAVVLLITGNCRVTLAHRIETSRPAKAYALLLLDQEKVHYELVEYMDRAVMRLDQLPPRVRVELLARKRM